MIQLRLPVQPLPIDEPLIIRLRDTATDVGLHDAVLIDVEGVRREYDFQGFSIVMEVPERTSLDKDVIMLVPGTASARRLIRADSNHNTLLVTEQCDQLCVMCSQPPKKHHIDLFPQLETAASLAPFGAYIGISGGEPLLHKQAVFDMLLSLSETRPDLKFHVLTNGQHFERQDLPVIEAIGVDRILWGIPLYAADEQTHDEIVKKTGAFDRLLESFSLLFEVGASVELRTVVLEQNYAILPQLASFIGTSLPFLERWAIMQLESIGYGRMNWATSFKDTSCDFGNVGRCINIAVARDIPVQLYNFPLCSIPQRYRDYAAATISDWKNKHESFCSECLSRQQCGGFFTWYDHSIGFKELGPL